MSTKMSNAAKAKWKNPAFRQRMCESMRRAWIGATERRSRVGKIVSVAQTKRWSDPKAREVESLAKKKLYMENPQLGLAMSNTLKTLYHKNTRLRKKVGKAVKKFWRDNPKARVKFSANCRRRFSDPAEIKKLSDGHKKDWARHPERRLAYASMQAKAITKLMVPNSCEMRLSAILASAFPGRFSLNVKNGVVIGGRVPDFVARRGKLVVELFGDYWHGRLRTGKSRWEVERERKGYFREYGFRTIIIWESELKNEEGVAVKIRKELENVG